MAAIGKGWVQEMMAKHGCIPALPDTDTTSIATFTARGLGEAIQSEIARAQAYGFTKLTLHFDIPDAALLARFLIERA